MKRIFLLAIIVAALLCASARTQRSTRKGLELNPVTEIQPESSGDTDTIAAPEPHTVDINGYDKPLRSRRETFFATNNTKSHIKGITFTISYFDSSRRLLHSASHNIAADIPAGETRQISIRSWDSQCSFYYIRSTVPTRAKQATPYEIALAVDTVFVARAIEKVD